jgi:crossover junction endodeoxyribonuclease RuvC
MNNKPIRVLGLDPGLRRTGWGVIDAIGTRLKFVATGTITSDSECALADRLVQLHKGLSEIIATHRPDVAAVENTFVNKDPVATLKLGQARAMALFTPASLGLEVYEYAPTQVKKAVVGGGHAEKDQVHHMVKVLLPQAVIAGPDAGDALALAICHAHLGQTANQMAALLATGGVK